MYMQKMESLRTYTLLPYLHVYQDHLKTLKLKICLVNMYCSNNNTKINPEQHTFTKNHKSSNWSIIKKVFGIS